MSDPTDPVNPGTPAGPPTQIVFEDPYVKATKTETAGGLELRFPLFDAASLPDIIQGVCARSREVFARLSPPEIQDAMNRLDGFFTDPTRPEIRTIIDLIHRIDGFSRHDIERFGLGIFPPSSATTAL